MSCSCTGSPNQRGGGPPLPIVRQQGHGHTSGVAWAVQQTALPAKAPDQGVVALQALDVGQKVEDAAAQRPPHGRASFRDVGRRRGRRASLSRLDRHVAVVWRRVFAEELTGHGSSRPDQSIGEGEGGDGG